MNNVDDIFNSEDVLIQEKEEFSYQKYLDDWYAEAKREGRLLVTFYFNITGTYFHFENKIDSEIEIALRQETMKRKISKFLNAWGRSSRIIQFTPKYIYPFEMKKELEILFPIDKTHQIFPTQKMISFSIDFRHSNNRLYEFLIELCRIIFLNVYTKCEIYITNLSVENIFELKNQMHYMTASISNLNAISNYDLMYLFGLSYIDAITEYNKFTERRTLNFRDW